MKDIDVIELQVPYSNKMSFLRRALAFFHYASRSARVALSESYDLVFATSTPLTAAITGIVAYRLRRKPFIFEVRDLWPDLPRQMGVIRNPAVLLAMKLLERTAYRSAVGCIGLAPGIVEGIVNAGGNANTTIMIPNGCDLELFQPVARRREPGEDFRAVFAGTHGIANGLDAVLHAAKVLKRRRRDDIRIEFIGDGALKAKLIQRARTEALDNCVFRDPLPRRELAIDLPSADVGLQILADVPGFYLGTSPNKFFDYLASGIPVLTNYTGWVAEMIESHTCGIAVPPNDAVAFANALEYLADAPVKLHEMGVNARRLGENEFDRLHLAERFVACLENAVSL